MENIRDLIKELKQSSTTPDELLMADRFETYLDLIDLKRTASGKELNEIEPRLQETFLSLAEVCDRLSVHYGMSPTNLLESFTRDESKHAFFAATIENTVIPREPLKKKSKLKSMSKKLKI